MNDDKGIVYCTGVRQGNWYEASTLEEYKLDKFLDQMKNGKLMLAKFRKMTDNLNKLTTLTQSTASTSFGAKITLLAPHVNASDPPDPNKKGMLFGGRLSANDIEYTQELVDGCSLVGLTDHTPRERSTFVITSADYCDRTDEELKYNQEFLLTLSCSVDKTPLYARYDPNPIPGLNGKFPVYLSEHPVSNARWRVLPDQKNHITRFEQEGRPVLVNDDIVINHCSTNLNLAINSGCWGLGFNGKVCSVILKNVLNVYKCELPENIWQIYVPVAK